MAKSKLEEELDTYSGQPTPKIYNEFFKAAESAIRQKTPFSEFVEAFGQQHEINVSAVGHLFSLLKDRDPSMAKKLQGKEAKDNKPIIFTDDYFVIDFETGGFKGTPGFRPVEYGILLYRSGQIKIKSGLVNPYLDDAEFAFPISLEDKLGISGEEIRSSGIHPRDCMSELSKLLSHPQYLLPVWGHNLIGFDRHLYDQELTKYGGMDLVDARVRDSAALYKALKMGAHCDNDNFLGFMTKIMNTPRKGLKYSIAHILQNEDLPLKMTWRGDELLDFEPNPEIGITDEVRDQVKVHGLHRAGFDCLMTHVIIQWLKQNTDDMFLES